MKFPNAYSGIKKIFIAEILSIVSVLFIFITSILVLVGIINIDTTAGAVSVLASILLLVASGVVSIVSFILNIVGVSKASQDEPLFRPALIFIFVGIIASILSTIFVRNTLGSVFFSTIGDVLEILISIYIVQGIIELAAKYDNYKLQIKGHTILKIMLIVCALGFASNLFVICFGYNGLPEVFYGTMGIVGGVLGITQYVLFLTLLAQAKKMLKA